MLNIKEIAPKLTQKLSIAINDDEAVEFAEALIAEVQKQNKPVAKVLFRRDEDGLEPVMFYGPGTEPNPAKLKDHFTLRDVWISPPIPEPQWKSIESAPKNGTEVLIYSETYGADVAQFHKGKWRTTAGQCDIEYPTNWMPLPEAPKGEQK